MTDTSPESHPLSTHLEQLALKVVMLTDDDVPALGAFLTQLEELQALADLDRFQELAALFQQMTAVGQRLVLQEMEATAQALELLGYGVTLLQRWSREEKWPRSKSESITASGILSLLRMGADPEDSGIRAGTRLILERLPKWNPETGEIDMYYWYFGTHALSLTGGSAWAEWRKAIRRTLIQNQHILIISIG